MYYRRALLYMLEDMRDIASSHLYKRVCPSVHPSVRWSVCRSVRDILVEIKGNQYF